MLDLKHRLLLFAGSTLLLASLVSPALAVSGKISPVATMARGSALYRSGRFVESETVFTEIIDREPRNLSARYYRGMILVRLNQPLDAIAEFKGIVAIDPHSAEAGLASEELNMLTPYMMEPKPVTVTRPNSARPVLSGPTGVTFQNNGGMAVNGGAPVGSGGPMNGGGPTNGGTPTGNGAPAVPPEMRQAFTDVKRQTDESAILMSDDEKHAQQILTEANGRASVIEAEVANTEARMRFHGGRRGAVAASEDDIQFAVADQKRQARSIRENAQKEADYIRDQARIRQSARESSAIMIENGLIESQGSDKKIRMHSGGTNLYVRNYETDSESSGGPVPIKAAPKQLQMPQTPPSNSQSPATK